MYRDAGHEESMTCFYLRPEYQAQKYQALFNYFLNRQINITCELCHTVAN